MPRGRPRKAQQAEKQDKSAPSPNGLSDEQKRALFLQSLVKLEALLDINKTAVANVRNQRKLMKSEGFSPARVNYALELRRKAPDEMLERERERLQTAAWLAHDVGYQGKLFDDYHDRTPAVDRAHDEGKIAAYEDKPCRPPYDAATEQGQAWIKGHREGQATIARGFKPLADDEDIRPEHLKRRERERRGMTGAPSAPSAEDSGEDESDGESDAESEGATVQ